MMPLRSWWTNAIDEETAYRPQCSGPTDVPASLAVQGWPSVVMPRVFLNLKNMCRTGARLDFPASICDIRVL
jgi:hypothetical protein